MTVNFGILGLQIIFFRTDEIRNMELLPLGDTYIIIYLKLMAESVSTGGYLRVRKHTSEYNLALGIAKIVGKDIQIVVGAISYFKAVGLIEVLEDEY
ncbi:MAG: phage replisome organizer N-terminal domain-containing protein [Eubacteriales bacterium]|nr:phage replisome organizer N-terminal domain-containing protein [Eubacteriales bacterium]MDY3332166.1 phage replisome organizer N-terminal domain-containing protein [Gallibacter sp.]